MTISQCKELNRFHTGQGLCTASGAWPSSDKCQCEMVQVISHIVN